MSTGETLTRGGLCRSTYTDGMSPHIRERDKPKIRSSEVTSRLANVVALDVHRGVGTVALDPFAFNRLEDELSGQFSAASFTSPYAPIESGRPVYDRLPDADRLPIDVTPDEPLPIEEEARQAVYDAPIDLYQTTKLPA